MWIPQMGDKVVIVTDAIERNYGEIATITQTIISQNRLRLVEIDDGSILLPNEFIPYMPEMGRERETKEKTSPREELAQAYSAVNALMRKLATALYDTALKGYVDGKITRKSLEEQYSKAFLKISNEFTKACMHAESVEE